MPSDLETAPPASPAGPSPAAVLRLYQREDPAGFFVEAGEASVRLHFRRPGPGSVQVGLPREAGLRVAPMHVGQVLLLPPGTSSSWRIGLALRRLSLALDPRLLEQQLAGAALPLLDPFHDPGLDHCAGLIEHELGRSQAPPPELLDTLTRLLVLQLGRVLAQAPTAVPAVSAGLDDGQQAKIAEYVERRLPEPILIADIAELLGLSQYQLLRRVKQTTGDTAQAYVQRLRIDLARRLLRESERSLTDIAMALGYSSPSHFSHSFRTWVRMSPSEYREQSRRR